MTLKTQIGRGVGVGGHRCLSTEEKVDAFLTSATHLEQRLVLALFFFFPALHLLSSQAPQGGCFSNILPRLLNQWDTRCKLEHLGAI